LQLCNTPDAPRIMAPFQQPARCCSPLHYASGVHRRKTMLPYRATKFIKNTSTTHADTKLWHYVLLQHWSQVTPTPNILVPGEGRGGGGGEGAPHGKRFHCLSNWLIVEYAVLQHVYRTTKARMCSHYKPHPRQWSRVSMVDQYVWARYSVVRVRAGSIALPLYCVRLKLHLLRSMQRIHWEGMFVDLLMTWKARL